MTADIRTPAAPISDERLEETEKLVARLHKLSTELVRLEGPAGDAWDLPNQVADFIRQQRARLETAERERDERAAEIAAKDALARKLSDALLKVRPLGGSEMFTRVGEEFYADPKYCGDAIEALHQRCREAITAEIRSERRATAAEAREAALREALERSAQKFDEGDVGTGYGIILAALASSPTQEDADDRPV